MLLIHIHRDNDSFIVQRSVMSLIMYVFVIPCFLGFTRILFILESNRSSKAPFSRKNKDINTKEESNLPSLVFFKFIVSSLQVQAEEEVSPDCLPAHLWNPLQSSCSHTISKIRLFRVHCTSISLAFPFARSTSLLSCAAY